jgi:hypothetical protein
MVTSVILLATGAGVGFIAAALILLNGRPRFRTVDLFTNVVDLPSARYVEVTHSRDRRRLWINTENGLVLRIYGIGTLITYANLPGSAEEDSPQ